ncbi:MAG: hypothetical protein ACO2PP_15940 [Thermocrinis sp.]|jgi:hypothetical protein|uniref:hypothetical protein n=1 Tax=Thermocrinis sp. TaxID=2024383 RepID=UPI003C06B216
MKKFMLIMALFIVAPVVKSQENPFLVPERANMRINVAVQIAKQLKDRGYDKIAVVYMNTSDLCALTAASLVASLKTLDVEAYYLKGADPDLPSKIRNLGANWIYLAYFGERPHEEVQKALNQDLRILASSFEKANLIVHPSTLGLGFLAGALVDDKIGEFLSRSNIKGFTVQQGKAEMVSVKVKDLEITIEPEPLPKKETPKTPTRKRTR